MTLEQFEELTPGLSPAKRAAYLPLLLEAAREAEITTPVRLAAFLAQLLHESAGLRYFQELWDPTPAQRRYEGRLDLGNTEPGDGERFKGRGPIQITGRANYAKYGALLGLDLVNQPELAAKPSVGFRIAAAYWTDKRLNALADRGTKAAFITLTRRINGGVNGLEDRLARWRVARRVLGV
jgi:putative chitinase